MYIFLKPTYNFPSSQYFLPKYTPAAIIINSAGMTKNITALLGPFYKHREIKQSQLNFE